jgi:hypothetical protein
VVDKLHARDFEEHSETFESTPGLDEKLGRINRLFSVADAVDDFQNDPARSAREIP